MKKISIATTGDSIITMRVSVHKEPRFLRLVKLIQSSDAAFTNLEMLVHDYEEDAYPSPQSGGTYMRADPNMLDQLTWIGFNLLSTANNHSLDYMYGGLFTTIKNLKYRNIPFAGTGVNLAESRKPAYLETSNGRVGLVAASSSFASFNIAGESRKDMKGRPGLNPLRFETYYVVNQIQLETFKKIAREISLPEVVQPEDSYYFMGEKFVIGENIGVHTQIQKADLEANIESVKEAVRQSDWVIFSHHSHQGKAGNDDQPAEYMEESSHAIIEAGAHAIIGHGHHAMRGIEIWKDRPIFYCLGNFLFQNQTIEKLPAQFYQNYGLDPQRGTPADAYDARRNAPPKPGQPNRYGYPKYKYYVDNEKYWMSILPIISFKGDKLSELKLYPLELGQSKPRSQAGRPILANGKLANKILTRIIELSKPYGTDIAIEKDVGIVTI